MFEFGACAGTDFESSEPLVGDVTNGHEQTVLAFSDLRWTAPLKIPASRAQLTINRTGLHTPRSLHRSHGHEKAPRLLVPDVGPRETGRFRERQLLAQLLHAERSIAVVLLRDAAERIAGAGTLTEPCRADVTK